MTESRSDDPSHYLRTELLERVAHELRGPAGVTLGALEELEHALGAEQVAENRLLFAMARRGVLRVLRTAERLTRTAMLESGSTHISPALGDLRALVRQATQDAELTEGRSSVRVSLTVGEEPCLAQLDAAWMTAALQELISQAIRAARREVSVMLEPGATLRLSVTDDRIALSDHPAVRFVSIADRRDSSLGWPLLSDVAKAHRAELNSEPLHDAAGKVTGLKVTLHIPASG